MKNARIHKIRTLTTLTPGVWALWLAALCAFTIRSTAQNLWMLGIEIDGDEAVVKAVVDEDVDYVILESQADIAGGGSRVLVVGEMEDRAATVTFRVPVESSNQFLTTRTYTGSRPPRARYRGNEHFEADYENAPLAHYQEYSHVMDRLGYGPLPEDYQRLQELDIPAYINEQLNPETIEERRTFRTRESLFFDEIEPARETVLIGPNAEWRYYKGQEAPTDGWIRQSYPATDWRVGNGGFGYGDGIEFGTYLSDMRSERVGQGYATLYLRTRFSSRELNDASNLWLRVDYDSGFVAYLNGVEVARSNVSGENPGHSEFATRGNRLGDPELFDITEFKDLLSTRRSNIIAVELHNDALDSPSAGIFVELLDRVPLDMEPYRQIESMEQLQELLHTRAIDSKRQLEAVMGEFWENHFTTDGDKVADYFDRLRNPDGSDALTYEEACLQAAQVEYLEYQFFYENAFKTFGDLLLYSATSPAQLIYLDNVSNTNKGPNENYAREILELFAFGVDNRYNQTDIEELARCFTGWSIGKVWPDQVKSFPGSARYPILGGDETHYDEPIIELGERWSLAKATLEPSVDSRGRPTTEWALPEFDDRRWSRGAATPVGFGDNDDKTILRDMRGNYSSIYMRKDFSIDQDTNLYQLVLSIDYDDAYIVYLNGEEIDRSSNAPEEEIPPHTATATGSREARGLPRDIPLSEHAGLLRVAPERNTLAIRGFNASLWDDDLTIAPRLVERIPLPERVDYNNASGVWTFLFNPEDHDYDAKTIFAGTEHEIRIPGGRRAQDGVRDAIDVIDRMANHPSTREFICIKLLNRFVSDAITLESYHAGTAPEGLLELHREAMEAWETSSPPGNIRDVLLAIFDPVERDGYFWSRDAYRAKVKTPFEFINSSVRALNGRGFDLAAVNERMGMSFFTRDDPDGWSEFGFDWMNTSAVLERVKFAQDLASREVALVSWNPRRLMRQEQFESADQALNYVDRAFFQGSLSRENREVLAEYFNTDVNGRFFPLDTDNATQVDARLRDLMGLILSSPHWNFQ